MTIRLRKHQILVLPKLKTGSVLCGGVGSGKSITSLVYYYTIECGGSIPITDKDEYTPMTKPKSLYIITTPKKRDSLEWEQECANLMISKDKESSINGVELYIDSWNNISKYKDVEDAFFIFDEQRVVGSGKWVKAFLKITKKNNWILLSATPGDTWMDYIPLFIANGFYKNRTEFIRKHVVYNNFTRYPKIDGFIETGILIKFRDSLLVKMNYKKPSVSHNIDFIVSFDSEKFNKVLKDRWNPYSEQPIKEVGEYYHLMRKVVNSDPSRLDAVKSLYNKHGKLIVFYNFNYELDLLRSLKNDPEIQAVSEYNGHFHEGIPDTEKWIYLVQYVSGAEGWNCILTNVVVFYSQHYSYKITTQSSGRIDRMNTPFLNLYYYRLMSNSYIDLAINKSFKSKQDFNEGKAFHPKSPKPESRQEHML